MSELPVPAASAGQPAAIPAPQTLVCSNCGAALSGEYCSACGQRHEPHIHSMAHFAGEAFESITHADSRLWRTLWFLLAKPGRLTREFFDGRRAAYLPPFRLYLVISVAFFILGPSEDSNIAIRDAETLELEGAAPKTAKDDGLNTVKIQGLSDFCREFIELPDSDNAARNNLRDNCRKITQGDGRELGRNFMHNLPRAMFVFLPALAFAMWLLYWRPKRYYVEHLLFFVHNHAFVFLGFTILIIVGKIPVVGDYVGWGWVAGMIYMVWYLYRAQRVVYGQSTALTLPKYTFLLITYVAMSTVMFILTLFFTAMTL